MSLHENLPVTIATIITVEINNSSITKLLWRGFAELPEYYMQLITYSAYLCLSE